MRVAGWISRAADADSLKDTPAPELVDDHLGVEGVGLELVVRLETANVVRDSRVDAGPELR